MTDGFIDTNVIIHALTGDHHSAECQAFLAKLEAGESRAILEPYVIHELTYALPRIQKQLTKAEIARIVINIVSWPGVIVNKQAEVVDGITRWAASQGLAFVDAMLAASAINRQVPVYTKNLRELRAQGAEVPDSLF